jgi:hypothetical protein
MSLLMGLCRYQTVARPLLIGIVTVEFDVPKHTSNSRSNHGIQIEMENGSVINLVDSRSLI